MALLKGKKQRIYLADKIRMQRDSQDVLLEGSSWLTIGSMVSRLLGALYIIPWGAMMGANRDNANYLFYIAYNIYALVLQISTAGIPVAISKMVADNQSRKDYKTSWQLFKSAMLFMTLMGFVAAVAMYLVAPIFAKGGSPKEIADSILVIRALVPAVLLVPPLSLLRGYYQGYNDMAPSAKSQLWEQIVRIVYMLGMTYLVVRMMRGSFVTAVAHSTFAAFIGAVVAFVYLGVKLYRDLPGMKQLMEEGRPASNLSFGRIVLDIIREAIPFVIVTSSIQLISILDQETFQPLARLMLQMNFRESKELLTVFGFNANKIIMIVVSLAVSMATAALPLLAKNFSANQQQEVRNIIEKNIGLYAFVMFPASIGMAIVAEPIYNVFYSPDQQGTYLLMISCLMCIFMGAFTVVGSIHQALQNHFVAIKALGLAIVVKLLWQPMMIYFFQGAGALLATSVAFLVSSVYMGYHLYLLTCFDVVLVLKKIGQVALHALVMAVGSGIMLMLVKLVINVDRKVTALIATAVVAVVGIVIYMVVSLLTHLADEMLGSRVKIIRKKLHLKE